MFKLIKKLLIVLSFSTIGLVGYSQTPYGGDVGNGVWTDIKKIKTKVIRFGDGTQQTSAPTTTDSTTISDYGFQTEAQVNALIIADTTALSSLIYTNQDNEFEHTAILENVDATTLGSTKILTNANHSMIINEIRIIVQPDTMGLGTDPVINIGTNSTAYNNIKSSITLSSIAVNKLYDYDDIALTTIGDLYINIGTASISSRCNLTVIVNYKLIAFPAVTTDYFSLSTYGTVFFKYDAYDIDNMRLTSLDSVNTILDGSGNNRTLTTSGSSKVKDVKASKYLAFKQTTLNQYEFTSSIDLDTVYSIVLVYNNNNAANGIFWWGNNTTNADGYIGNVSGAFTHDVAGGYASQYASQNETANRIIIITRHRGTIVCYKDGTPLTEASNTITTQKLKFQVLGGSTALSSTYYPNCNIYFMGAINTVLTQTQVTTITALLKTRYGI